MRGRGEVWCPFLCVRRVECGTGVHSVGRQTTRMTQTWPCNPVPCCLCVSWRKNSVVHVVVDDVVDVAVAVAVDDDDDVVVCS